MIEIEVKHGSAAKVPVLIGECRWESFARGAPGKLEFSAISTAELSFYPGDKVTAKKDGAVFFVGYLFTVTETGAGEMRFVAYDALRYFKNKDTYIYENITASALLRRICADVRVPVGSIADTGYLISQRVEEDATLFDIIENALDLTYSATGKRFIMHCDNGKICLSSTDVLDPNQTVNENTVLSYQNQLSIDRDVYTRVRLRWYDRSSGQYHVQTASSEKAKQFGVLQLFQTLDETMATQKRAVALLNLTERPICTVRLSIVDGDISLRAGVTVHIHLSDVPGGIYGKYVPYHCVHRFTEGTDEVQLDLCYRAG